VRRPSPGRTLASGRRRLGGARYFLADVAYAIGHFVLGVLGFLARFPIAIWRGVSGFWGSLTVIARRRLLAAVAVAAVIIAFLAAAVPNLPCELPGGDSCPPTDDAAQIVPADSLAYLHANVDPGTDEYDAATELAAQLPLFTQQLVARALALVPGPGGGAPDFKRDIDPWFGGEVALALLPRSGRGGEPVVAFEVDESAGTTEYAKSIAAGQPSTEEYRGFELTVDERGVASSQVGGFLVIGSQAGVRAVLETGSGDSQSPALAGDDVADEVRDELPDHRLAEAYVSAEGAADLARSSGALRSLAPLIAPESTRGAAAAISVSGDELELSVRSLLDPELEKSSPNFFAAFPEFEPELPEKLSDQALAYLGLGAPGQTVRELLTQAAAGAPGIADSFRDLVRSLKKKDAVDLETDLLSSLGDEAAFAVEPASAGGEQAAGGVPYLQFLARGVDEEKIRQSLANLQGPLSEAASPGGDLQAPVFGEQEVGGVQVRSLRVSPTINLAYAVFDGLAVIATDPAGVAQVASGEGGLDSTGSYERATGGFSDESSLLAFFDLRRLLAEGFAIGLAQVPAFNTFADDFRHLDALGVQVDASNEQISTDARLVVTEPPADQESPAQGPGSD
jgi:Protein of unknown function (DUF3352)